MSCNFELNEKYFILCCVNLQIVENYLNFGISILDSYTNTVKICEVIDNDFFTTVENILIQIAPAHEEIQFFVIGNFPLDFYGQKFLNLVEKMEMVDKKQILINSKEFLTNRNLDSLSTIKLLLTDSESNLNNPILSRNEMILGLNTLNGVINFTRILQYPNYQNKFSLEKYNLNEFMNFDMTCVKCLNLFDNIEDKKLYMSNNSLLKISGGAGNAVGSSKNSVFNILNLCCTKFGTRTLRAWLLQPLQSIQDIQARSDIVELFLGSVYFKHEIRNTYLSKIDDVQTINMNISKYISKRDETIVKLVDCVKLQNCISVCKNLYEYMKCYEGNHSEIFFKNYVNHLEEVLKRLIKLEEMFAKTIIYDSKTREYIINPSLNTELSSIQQKIDESWKQIEDIKDEVESNLNNDRKQKFIKVKIGEYEKNGYNLEIVKHIGEQFMKTNNKFRLVTSNKAYIVINNNKMVELSAEIRELKQEYKSKEKIYYKKVIEVASTYHPLLERLIYILSEIDVLTSFATLVQNSKEIYAKPIFKNEKTLVLKDSRHLILEWNEDIIRKNNPTNKNLIANDCYLEKNSNIKLITGINMGGKSTYLRQVGICVLLAHIGMYVPASYFELPIVDQIFTRVGAGDLMLKGISTYMNEMIEVCSLIKSATSNSLLLIDELGRGTSTDDGIGISYAILHYISNSINCFCLFATHFFELTDMENILHNVTNYYVSYSVFDGELVMDYKILKGKTNNSFGVNLFKSLKFDEDTCETLKQFM